MLLLLLVFSVMVKEASEVSGENNNEFQDLNFVLAFLLLQKFQDI
jgi:hypothetical protein